MVEDGKNERLDREPPENADPGRLPPEPMSVIDANLAASDAGSDSDEASSDEALLYQQRDESDDSGVSLR